MQAASSTNQAATLKQIHIYPIKSSAGLSLSHSWLDHEGLAFDRRYVVVTPQGQMITGRTHPQLAKLIVSLQVNALVLSHADHPQQADCYLPYAEFTRQPMSASIWGDEFVGLRTHDLADQWFSALLGEPAFLLYTGEKSPRQKRKNGETVSFADGYALMMLSEASLDSLNQQSPEPHQLAQFRPNLVLADCAAFAEDTWAKIKIGEVVFRVDKPCSRCIFTTLDLTTGKFRDNKEPLATLETFRQGEDGQVYFGVNLTPLNAGLLQVGAPIEVLETREPPRYPQQAKANALSDSKKAAAPRAFSAQSVVTEKLVLEIHGYSFLGNNQQTLLSQGEKQGILMNYRCRSGRCGECKVQLVEGEVEQAPHARLSPADRASGQVLACCAVPKTAVKITHPQ